MRPATAEPRSLLFRESALDTCYGFPRFHRRARRDSGFSREPPPIGRLCLFPILFLFFFLFFVEEFFVFVLQFFGGFEFQWLSADDFQSRAAFVTTQRVAFVHIFLVHVNCSLAYRTSDHISPSRL